MSKKTYVALVLHKMIRFVFKQYDAQYMYKNQKENFEKLHSNNMTICTIKKDKVRKMHNVMVMSGLLIVIIDKEADYRV